MKYVKVKGEDLNVGDIVCDCDPTRTCATKFEVVGINENKLVLKQKNNKSYYYKREDGATVFSLSGTWYREEASND